jgi:hypothetical protein
VSEVAPVLHGVRDDGDTAAARPRALKMRGLAHLLRLVYIISRTRLSR